MGRIAQKMVSTFQHELSAVKRAAGEFTDGLPFDLATLDELAQELSDPQHVLYVAAHQFASAFAESVSEQPEFAGYSAIVGKAEDEYMPEGPPVSPLTRSFFTLWAFFDVRFGADRETIGSCMADVLRAMNAPDLMLGTLEKLSASRMGIYEQVGLEGPHVRLRELLSGDEFVCHSTSGYQGQFGELWYVRLCPPVAESFDYHLVLTTPYVLSGSSREDWTAFLNRSLLDATDKQRGMQDLLKYGSERVNWCEFVFQAYHHHQHDAIFLTGLPDVADSLPHSPQRESLDEPLCSASLPAVASNSAANNPSSAANFAERLRCKLSDAQRKVMAELCPDLASQLKLDEPNQRTVELTRRDMDRVLGLAQAAMPNATHFRTQSLYKVVRILTHTTQRSSSEPRAPRQLRGKWAIDPTADSAPSVRSSSKSNSTKGTRQVYQFVVELSNAQPPIWRRFQVADCTLEELHFAIQGAMGWDVSHLYEFDVRGVRYSSKPPFDLGWDVDLGEDAGAVRFSELIPSNHRLQLRYLYDFGDSWEHVVKLEKRLDATPGTKYPQCIDGARACPPEDCGGIYGYFDLVEALSNPQHERHDELLEWIGPYDSEAFDVVTATKLMRKFARF